MVLPSPIFPLQCGVQSYDWGVVGEKSKVAQFASTSKDFKVEDKPYAEVGVVGVSIQ